jgi:hypothetical protein
MTTYYVYSPVTGQIWGRDNYCAYPYDSHPIVFGSSPRDVSSNPLGQRIDFFVWPAVTCLERINTGNVVCDGLPSPEPAPWDYGVEIAMYSGYFGTGDWFGSAFAGHVDDPWGNGFYNDSTGTTYGWISPDTCPGLCNCYDGEHVHMERWFGSTRSLSCNQWLGAGTDWLFSFVY